MLQVFVCLLARFKRNVIFVFVFIKIFDNTTSFIGIILQSVQIRLEGSSLIATWVSGEDHQGDADKYKNQSFASVRYD